MNTITQFKNAIALIVIAGAIIFIGDIVTAASPEVVTPDVSSPEVVTPDVSSPEVVTPDVVITPGRAIVADFNGDLHPDFVLYNHSTHQTAIWYMNNNVHIGCAFWSNHSNRLGPRVCGGFQRRQPYRLCTVQSDYSPNFIQVNVRANVDRKRSWANASKRLGIGSDRRL